MGGQRVVWAIGVLIGVAAVFSLSQLAVESVIPNACDQPYGQYPADRQAGCDFLDDGGYQLIRFVPALLLARIALVAYKRRLPWVFVGGLLVVIAALAFLIFASPERYPWI